MEVAESAVSSERAGRTGNSDHVESRSAVISESAVDSHWRTTVGIGLPELAAALE